VRGRDKESAETARRRTQQRQRLGASLRDHADVLLAATVPTWIQVGGFAFAAITAIATVAIVWRSRRNAKKAREPHLVPEPNFIEAEGETEAMGIAIVNAGGSVAGRVRFILAVDDTYGFGWPAEGLLRPNETLRFGSKMRATEDARAVVFCSGQDQREYAWNLEGKRKRLRLRRIRSGNKRSDEEIFRAFYRDTDFGRLRKVGMYRR